MSNFMPMSFLRPALQSIPSLMLAFGAIAQTRSALRYRTTGRRLSFQPSLRVLVLLVLGQGLSLTACVADSICLTVVAAGVAMLAYFYSRITRLWILRRGLYVTYWGRPRRMRFSAIDAVRFTGGEYEPTRLLAVSGNHELNVYGFEPLADVIASLQRAGITVESSAGSALRRRRLMLWVLVGVIVIVGLMAIVVAFDYRRIYSN